MLRLAALAFALAAAAPAAGQGSGAVCGDIACESLGATAWIGVWRDAALAADGAAEAEALHRLDTLAFWPPPVVALARWTLEAAPSGAILLAHGDGDAIPAAMLQHTDRLRPDVTVVHVGLLAEPGYVRRLAEGDGLPLGPDPAGLLALDALVAFWIAEAASGHLDRPVVGTLTLDADVIGRHAPAVVSAGAYQRPGTATEPPFDRAAAEAAAGHASGADFVGPRVSPADCDSARVASPVDLGGVVLFQLLQTAVSHAQAGDAAAAEQAYARARTFAVEAQTPDDPLVAIAREWIDAALAGPPTADSLNQPR